MNKTTKILVILFTVSLLLVGCGQKEKTKSTTAQTTSQRLKKLQTIQVKKLPYLRLKEEV